MKPIEETYLWKYYEQCKRDGVCNSMMMCLERYISDVSRDDLIYDTSLFDEMKEDVEHICLQTKAPFTGKPIKLELWQCAYLESLLSFKWKKNGLRRFTRSLLLIGRKCGKTSLMVAILQWFFLFGDGGNDAIMASNTDEQTNLLYENFWDAMKQIDGDEEVVHRNNRGIKNTFNLNSVAKMTSKQKNLDGKNVFLGVIDEVHESIDNGALLKSIEMSMSTKLEPLLIIITTHGFVRDNTFDILLEEVEGAVSGDDTGMRADTTHAFLFQMDSWKKLLENPLEEYRKFTPMLGVTKTESYFWQQFDAATKSERDKQYFRTKEGCVVGGSAAKWLRETVVGAAYAGWNKERFKGCCAVYGIDCAITTDVAAVVMIILYNGTYYVDCHGFIPAEKLVLAPDAHEGARYKEWADDGYMTIVDGTEVDTALMSDWIYAQYENYGIKPLWVGYDSRFSRPMIERLNDYGIDSEVVQQSRKVLTGAINLTEALFSAEHFVLAQNPLLKWCIENCELKVYPDETVELLKLGGVSARRIDCADALVDAIEMTRRYLSDIKRLNQEVDIEE